jgi:hypothetical protein
LDIVGLWIGPTLATAFNYFAYIKVFNSIDLDKLIAEAREKREAEKFK